MIIRQSGRGLVDVANSVRDKANNFRRIVEQMYQDIDSCLGDENQQQKIWYGPRAMGCKNQTFKAKPTMDNVAKDLNDLSDILVGQAKTWGQQQTSKY